MWLTVWNSHVMKSLKFTCDEQCEIRRFRSGMWSRVFRRAFLDVSKHYEVLTRRPQRHISQDLILQQNRCDSLKWYLVTTMWRNLSSCIWRLNIMYLLTAIGLLPGGSGYFTCKQNMKSVTTKCKLGELHEKHVVATWNVGNRLSICL